jgi:hypothetical protein
MTPPDEFDLEDAATDAQAKSREVKLPDVDVQLTGQDGNAFAVFGRVAAAMKRAGHGDRFAEYQREAMSGDYSHLLAVTMEWVNVS